MFDSLSPCEGKATKVNTKEQKMRVQRKNKSLICGSYIDRNLATVAALRELGFVDISDGV
jgi:hypothetical protein